MLLSMLNRKVIHLWFLACLFISTDIFAAGQFYFIGTTATEGATSSSGQVNKVVYLRWDLIEGKLPSDIVTIQLYRDGDLLLSVSPDEVMSESDIAKLYESPHQEQRLLTTISKLTENAIANGQSFNVSQYAQQIRNGLDNSYFAGIASKIDFNIARARNRAYIDKPTLGVHSYQLVAINAASATATLGAMTIDTRIDREILPVTDFTQVKQAQCGSPESGLDHHTVALDWASPGLTNITDKLASSLFVSGYDIYRTTTNLGVGVTVAPVRDIALLAMAAPHNQRGEVDLAGLEKVNDLPLMMSANKGGNPEWVETRNQLEDAGIKPGDRRAYYIVPIDFTGHYGATTATVINIPNLLRPAMPWDVTFYADEAEQTMHISWDDVNDTNFINNFRHNYNFCNALTAKTDGVLNYVPRGEHCLTATQRQINLDISGYTVFRFDTFEEASKFTTADKCDSAPIVLSSVTNQELLSGASGQESIRKRVIYQDDQPSINKSTVYWYRIASVSKSNRSSLLTAPLKALFPIRDLPDPPNVVITHPGRIISGCTVNTSTNKASWDLKNNITGIPEFNLNCPEAGVTLAVNEGNICDDEKVIFSSCGGTGRNFVMPVTAPDSFTCTAEIPDTLKLCEDGNQAFINFTYEDTQIPLTLGPPVSDTTTIVVTTEPGNCSSLFQTVNGRESRVATSCGTANPESLTYDTGTGFFCGYAVSQDENNNQSVAHNIPCPLIRPSISKAPSMPKPTGQRIVNNELLVRWKLPTEPLAATLIKVEHSENGQINDQVQMITVPIAGRPSANEYRHDISINTTDGFIETYCVSYKSIAPNNQGETSLSSPWTNPICTDKEVPLTPPSYLPWPDVPRTRLGSSLTVHTALEFASTDGSPGLSDSIGLNSIFIDLFSIESLSVDALCLHETEINNSINELLFADLWCNPGGYLKVNSELGNWTSFIVYRQPRDSSLVLGNWIQVSPLIEFAHWDKDDSLIDKTGFGYNLNDPFIKLYKDPAYVDRSIFVFRDNYPYVQGKDYRYQIVFFAANHNPELVRETDWINTNLSTSTP